MATFGPPPPLTVDELLAVLERNMEGHWIGPLLQDPTARSIFEAWATQFVRVAAANDENFSRQAFILTSTTGKRAQTYVRLFRASGSSGLIDVGKRFQDNRGMIWQPAQDVEVSASGGAQTIEFLVETQRTGYFLNSFEPLSFSILDELFDPNFSVLATLLPATAGKTSFLTEHGKERGVSIADGESDADFAARLLFLEDQISPKALAGEAMLKVLDQFAATQAYAIAVATNGLRLIREPFRDPAQDAQINLTGCDPVFADRRYFCDDPHGAIVRDRFQALGFFDVLLPTLVDPNESRAFFADDGYFDDSAYYDGTSGDAITTPVAVLADELDRRRAACVRFWILSGEPVPFVRVPVLEGLVQAGDFVDQDGASTDDEMVRALERVDGDTTYVVSGTGTGSGAAMTSGDLVFEWPALSPAPTSVSHVVLTAWVRKRDVGAGVDPALMFLVRPGAGGTFTRASAFEYPVTIDHEDWRPYRVILEVNPQTTLAWMLADVVDGFGMGIANAAAAGATEELLCTELSLEIVVGYD